MEILQQFETSLTSPTAPVIHAVQFDEARQIRLRIYSGAEMWPVPADVTAGIGYTLPNRAKGYFERLTDDTPVCTINGNEVTALLAPILTSVAGTAQIAVVLRQGDRQISTFPLQIKVAARPGAMTKPDAQPDAASEFAGKLFYGSETGQVVPLAIGRGLNVSDGALHAAVPENMASKAYVDEAVAELWAEIRYVPIAISSLKNSGGTVELGTELESVTISWSLNKNPATQVLYGVEIPLQDRSFAMPGPFRASTKFTLEVTDERGAADSASTSVNFYNGVYYGAMSESGQITSETIYELTRKLQSGRGVTFTVDAGGKRPVYACPERYGTPKFVIAGFEYEWQKVVSLDFVNRSGYTERYDVWMHGQNVAGSITVTVS